MPILTLTAQVRQVVQHGWVGVWSNEMACNCVLNSYGRCFHDVQMCSKHSRIIQAHVAESPQPTQQLAFIRTIAYGTVCKHTYSRVLIIAM